jgi:3-hydroxyisobutyrate dehydrogenase
MNGASAPGKWRVREDAMETVGFVGVGKIGLPISENLIKSGYRVLGYRRGSLEEFEKAGGIRARSPADIAAEADIVFSCLPSSEALDQVVQGAAGARRSGASRPDRRRTRFASGARQGAADRAARRQGRDVSRR